MMGLSIILVALALISACGAQEYEEWTKAITEEDNLGKQDITFNCSEFPIHPRPTYVVEGEDVPPFDPSEDKPVAWMLPNLTIVRGTGTFDDKIIISDDHWYFTVKNVTKEDFGVYHCMVNLTSAFDDTWKYYLVKWGINMRGPYFEDLWEKYRMNTIIGLSACFGFTAFMIIICLVWQYRWQPAGSDSEPEPYTGNRIKAYSGEMVNHGFATDEPIATTSTSYNTATGNPAFSTGGITTTPIVTYTVNPPDSVSSVDQDTRF